MHDTLALYVDVKDRNCRPPHAVKKFVMCVKMKGCGVPLFTFILNILANLEKAIILLILFWVFLFFHRPIPHPNSYTIDSNEFNHNHTRIDFKSSN